MEGGLKNMLEVNDIVKVISATDSGYLGAR